nr:hypothetical protein HK105_008010 [Polyrhizophydium stewartii]
METDKMAGAQYGERVPYVVVHSGPKHRLVDAVVSPHELLSNRALRLHATYYITKQINPALARMFNLIGADVEKWFQEMPKIIRVGRYVEADQEHTALDRGRTIDQFYVSRHCISALNEAAFTSQLETRMAQIQRESEERLSSEFVNFMTSLASD